MPRRERPQCFALATSADAELVAPALAHQVSRKYLVQIPNISTLGANWISSVSIADHPLHWDRAQQIKKFLDRRYT